MTDSETLRDMDYGSFVGFSGKWSITHTLQFTSGYYYDCRISRNHRIVVDFRVFR